MLGKYPASWIRDPWGERDPWTLHDMLSQYQIGVATQKDPPELWRTALCQTRGEFPGAQRPQEWTWVLIESPQLIELGRIFCLNIDGEEEMVLKKSREDYRASGIHSSTHLVYLL